MQIVQLMTDRSRYFNPSKNYWFTNFNAFLISKPPRASGGLGPRGSALGPLGTVCGPQTPRLLTHPLTTNPGSAPVYNIDLIVIFK
jgi:hypothetical protein